MTLSLPVLLRTTAGIAAGLLLLVVARGDAQSQPLRIGLQTNQAQVRLQGTVPLHIETAGQAPVATLAEQVVVFEPAQAGVTITDADGKPLLTATAAVQVKPQPAPADGTPSPVVPALIRLLGPTRHYDGKADRPYRGSMELSSRDGGLTLVNVVDSEEYLLGVVSSEMSPRYPLEALKAQAVAARTYALRNVGRCANQGYDLDDTPGCQVYGGYLSEDPRTTQAVRETAGQVLLYNGKLIDAVYSSTCGGITESAENAWGHAVPYLKSVSDFPEPTDPATLPHDEDGWSVYFKTTRDLVCLQPKYANPQAFRWVKLVTRKEIEASLPAQQQVGTVTALTPLRRGASGRILALRIDGTAGSVTLEKELAVRKALGNLRSSAFVVDAYPDDNGVPVVFAFWGAGWGHGLGMCQVGAVGLADQGWTYDRILTRYYQGATLGQP